MYHIGMDMLFYFLYYFLIPTKPHDSIGQQYNQPQQHKLFHQPQQHKSFHQPQQHESFHQPQQHESFHQPQEGFFSVI